MIISKWVLILVFYATDTVTILESQVIPVENEIVCQTAKNQIEKQYAYSKDVLLNVTCIKTANKER